MKHAKPLIEDLQARRKTALGRMPRWAMEPGRRKFGFGVGNRTEVERRAENPKGRSATR